MGAKWFLAAIVSVSCAHTCPKKLALNIEPGFSELQVTLILDAANEWKIRSGGCADVYFKIDGLKIKPWNSYYDPHYDWMGFYAKDRGINLILPALQDPRDFYSVTLHEMGHALGLKHHLHGIMKNPHDPEMFHLEKADIDALCKL